MLMHMEDLQNKMKDIQFMKVTREIQLVSNKCYINRIMSVMNIEIDIITSIEVSPIGCETIDYICRDLQN